MSLDVYLRQVGGKGENLVATSGIFIRENGQTKEITEEEWNTRHPNKTPVQLSYEVESDIVYENNITHNLVPMAKEVGVYQALWRPEEMGITKASELTAHLAHGLATLIRNPDKYKKLNPENGWGNYEVFVKFIYSYLGACTLHPDAGVSVSR